MFIHFNLILISVRIYMKKSKYKQGKGNLVARATDDCEKLKDIFKFYLK